MRGEHSRLVACISPTRKDICICSTTGNTDFSPEIVVVRLDEVGFGPTLIRGKQRQFRPHQRSDWRWRCAHKVEHHNVMRRDAQIEREEFPEHAGIEYFDCKKNLKSKQGLPIFCSYKRKESPSPLVPYATEAPFPNSKPLSSRFDDR